jgi:putative ABC transport system permease protein
MSSQRASTGNRVYKTYFVSAWRHLLRQRMFSVLRICGLAIGMASALLLFLREFTVLVLVAAAVAVGPTLYVAHRWLQSFAYRTSVDFMVLLEPALVALCVALISVSLQITRVVLVDPVTSLRYE